MTKVMVGGEEQLSPMFVRLVYLLPRIEPYDRPGRTV